MHFFKKRIGYILILIITCVFFVGCKNTNNNVISNSASEEIITKEQEDYLNNGYQIGDYKLLLTKNQKKNEKQTFIDNNFFEVNFLKIQDNIDLSKKINIILYGLHYSPEEERYTLGTFLINTTNTTIKKLSFTLTPSFKNIGDVEPIKSNFEGDDLVELPPKSFFTLAIYGDAPLKSADLLMENKGPDITFKITDLEINGEKVDNTNEH
ncbi:hypothetical protein BCR22_10590 [Enterococcus plantarum]|uniref:hypothetical protein n=1 Tax=Enterococcus plantarum TaxID=1077675 RepID=UPI00084D5446|nr:hypothetical protein [Enterococcus plantarum]OEG18782.1 hypothetical protein BCR22_10590 [Enterococcus plantarum]